jgi:hypothetical protein
MDADKQLIDLLREACTALCRHVTATGNSEHPDYDILDRAEAWLHAHGYWKAPDVDTISDRRDDKG